MSIKDERQEFEQNFKSNRHRIYHIVGRYISDACTIEDLTQHTFMRAWVSRQSFRGESSYSTWLTSIAIHTALNYIASIKRQPQGHKSSSDIEWYSDGLNTLEQVISDQEIKAINDAICNLPDELRTCMVLYVVKGLSYEAIAKCTGIPIGTVRSRLHRARYLLKELLR